MIRRAAFVAVAVVAAAGCGSANFKTSGPRVSAATTTTSPTTDSSTTDASTTSTAPSTTTSGPPVPGYMLPAPADYAVTTDPASEGAINGPITPSTFDQKLADKTGAASSLGFVRGYDIDYDNNATSESVESTVLTFASPADATRFATVVIPEGEADRSPVKSAIPSVPGSVVLTSSKADSDGFWYVDVTATAGPSAMVVEYSNDEQPTVRPAVVDASSLGQYHLLAKAPTS